MRIAVHPGTFDPITYGHIDVIERASNLFDHIYVVIAINSKKINLFNEDERLIMVKSSLKHLKNISVEFHNGLIVDYVKQKNAIAIIRGLRTVTDFDYEMQISNMNRKLNPDIHTVFLQANDKYTFLNSSIIRELGKYKQIISEYVPPVVQEMLIQKFE